MLRGESLQGLFPTLGEEVRADLHDQIMTRRDRRDRVDDLPHAEVVESWRAEGKLGPIVRMIALLVRPIRRFLKTALRGPLEDFPVAELHEMTVARQELIGPIKSAFVGQCDGQQDFIAAVLGHFGRGHAHVGPGRQLQAPAPEWQLCEEGGAEVHLDRHVAVRHVREERLADQALGQPPWLRDAHAVAEKADSVRVRAVLVEVEKHSNDLIGTETLTTNCPVAIGEVRALGIKGHRPFAIAEHEVGASS
mmetsp:Transcript_6801/g.16930  ORF Transcript_6801/g.16930 Transcript_6801/m.16930 type:complete len:250 (+) Transcript_6801:1531-2280(+)